MLDGLVEVLVDAQGGAGSWEIGRDGLRDGLAGLEAFLCREAACRLRHFGFIYCFPRESVGVSLSWR